MADKGMKIYLYYLLCIAVLGEISETEVNFVLNSCCKCFYLEANKWSLVLLWSELVSICKSWSSR